MRVRLLAAIVFLAAGPWACGKELTPLRISPSGSANISGPTVITSASGDTTWTLTGPGSLSVSSGSQTTYRPPATLGISAPVTATVTATANGQTASVTFSITPPQGQPGVIPGLHAPVTAVYDAQQIPHIFCSNQLDCLAAQGYVQAQDRLFQMDFFRRAGRGTLATMLGVGGASQDRQILTVFVTRDGKRIEDVLVAALDANTKAVLDAYSSGVNAFLAFLTAHPTLMPQEYAQLPGPPFTPADIPQWTPQDTLAIGRLQQFQLSETIEKETAYGLFALTYGPGGAKPNAGKFAAYVRAQQPLPGYTLSSADASPVAPPAAAPSRRQSAAPDLSRWAGALGQLGENMKELRPIFGALHLGSGSNNWVVDGAHSASGMAMVANDPHLSLQFPPLFHLSTMTASDASGLNVAGGAFPGIPGALIGRGAHVGWGVTVVGYDVTDLYLETVAPCAASPVGCVTFNSAQVPIVPVVYQLAMRGYSAPVEVDVLVVPHHGPIVSFDSAHGTAVSMRWTGHEVTADFRAFYNLNNASAVGDTSAAAGTAFAALKDFGTGAQNFVLADDAGHIGYDPHALVPRRAWLENPSNWATGPYPWFPMPGDGTAEWGSGSAADHCAGTGATPPAAACWVSDDKLPRGVDPAKGYLATANSDPAGYTGSPYAPFASTAPAGLYPYLSFDWSDPTDVRYSRVAELLKAKTTAPAKMSVADMQAVQSDHSMLIAKLFAQFLPAATSGQTNYAAALAMMNTWATDGYDCPTGLTSSDPKSAPDPDATHNRDSAACLLFHTFLGNVLNNVFNDDLAVVSKVTGRSFGADFGAEIRGLLYMLTLADNSAGASFCNDVDASGNTVQTHSCKDQLVSAMSSAYATLTGAYGASGNWLWGRVHTLTTASAGAPIIAGGRGPYARPGGALTVDVGNPDGTGFSYSHGSNVRFIAEMDPAASAVIKMQLPGPEHEARFGVFDDPDLIGQYVRNQYFDYAFGHQVDAAAGSIQGFTAQ
jgi:penicillin amidase